MCKAIGQGIQKRAVCRVNGARNPDRRSDSPEKDLHDILPYGHSSIDRGGSLGTQQSVTTPTVVSRTCQGGEVIWVIILL